MDVRDLIPTGLTISPAAERAIRASLHQQRVEPGDWVTAVVWLENEATGEAGPGLGYYYRSQLPADAIALVGELELVFALSTWSKAYFDNKMLDYVGGRLVLVERGLPHEC